MPTSLTISVTPREGADAREATLSCPGGDAQACEELARLDRTVFEPVPKDQVCTMILAGPQTATITGRVDGERLDASFSRANGCEEARWQQLLPLLRALDLVE
ncbi:MAG: hypothetical protein PGN07_05130 [Aeromicrobium erythreum]